MSLITSVYDSIKRKTSNEKEAARLGISLAQYMSLKEKILSKIQEISPQIDQKIKECLLTDEPINFELKPDIPESKVTQISENIDEGFAKIEGESTTEPKTPEEIIRLLKIDTSKWKLKQYWNKEKKSGGWFISALVVRINDEELAQNSFLNLLEEYKVPEIPVITTKQVNEQSPEKVCGVISLQDLHIGKSDTEDVIQEMHNALEDLMHKSQMYHIEELFFVIGADTLNMDTFSGTTTKGTPVDNTLHPTNAYLIAYDALVKAITFLSSRCDKLKVVYIPGNHDRNSSYHLVHALSVSFKKHTNIEFDTEYAERKVFEYGTNMLCFEHGDFIKSTVHNAMVYAVEYPEIWGRCRNRKAYIGHLHHEKTKEYITKYNNLGFSTKMLSALCSTDYYHHSNKYVQNPRNAALELNHKEYGTVAEFIYNVRSTKTFKL